MKRATIVIALALAVVAFKLHAQDPDGASQPAGGSVQSEHKGGPGHDHGGFHLLPPRAAEKLKLTDEQKKQLADLKAEVKAKLEKILTPAQLEQLKQMRPPHRQDDHDNGEHGAGGAGGSGGSPKPQRPASE